MSSPTFPLAELRKIRDQFEEDKKRVLQMKLARGLWTLNTPYFETDVYIKKILYIMIMG